jgi:hypothetical protein
MMYFCLWKRISGLIIDWTDPREEATFFKRYWNMYFAQVYPACGLQIRRGEGKFAMR